MTTNEVKSVEVKSVLRLENQESLSVYLEALGARLSDSLAVDATTPFLRVFDLYRAIESGDVDLKAVAPSICGNEQKVLMAIGGNLPEDRTDWGVRLVAYIAGIYIPAAVETGAFDSAVNVVQKLVSQVVGREFREVVGFGTEGDIPKHHIKTTRSEAAVTHRYILLTLPMAALCANYPDDLSRRTKQRIDDLFTVIAGLGRISPCTVIRTVSLICMNDSQERWRGLVKLGAVAAEDHGYKRLAQVLRQSLDN